MVRTQAGVVIEELQPIGGTLLWRREECDEKGAAKTKH